MNKERFKAGLARLGLHVVEQPTKSPAWVRVLFYERDPECSDPNFMGTYLGRGSFEHGELSSIKMFCGGYYAMAVQLMADKSIILSHINFYALHVKAYNATIDISSKGRRSAKRWVLFRKLFREKYYGEPCDLS